MAIVTQIQAFVGIQVQGGKKIFAMTLQPHHSAAQGRSATALLFLVWRHDHSRPFTIPTISSAGRRRDRTIGSLAVSAWR